MNGLLWVAQAAVSMPRPKSSGYLRRQAVLIGLAVRLVNLFEALLGHMAQNHKEIAMLLNRAFLESTAILMYLLKQGSTACESYIQTSYRAEKEMLETLNGIRKERALTPIEKRMRSGIAERLRVAGVRQKDLLSRTDWRLDGKSMRDILDDLDWSTAYAFGFAGLSHFVHGTWHDLVVHHLARSADEHRKYFPAVEFTESDPRLVGPPSILLAERVLDVMEKFELDQDETVSVLVHEYRAWFLEYDRSVEIHIQAES